MQDFSGIDFSLVELALGQQDTSDYDEIIGWFATEIIAEFEIHLAQVARLEAAFAAPSYDGEDH